MSDQQLGELLIGLANEGDPQAQEELILQNPEVLGREADAYFELVQVKFDGEGRASEAARVGFVRSMLSACRLLTTRRAFSALRGDADQSGAVGSRAFEEARTAESRYRSSGDMAALDDAVAAWQTATAERLALGDEVLAPLPLASELLHLLAEALILRYRESADSGDIDAAIDASRTAAESASDAYVHTLAASAQARALRLRYQLLGDGGDLDLAIQIQESLLEDVDMALLADSSDGRRYVAATAGNLGNALRTRFEAGGASADPADVRAAVGCQRIALQFADDDGARGNALLNLGTALFQLSVATGSVEHVDEAIRCYREVITLPVTEPRQRPLVWSNLSSALHKRFELLGELDDLAESIESDQQAMRLTRSGSPDEPTRLHSHALGLWTRYRHSGDIADLDLGVESLSAALNLMPIDAEERADLLSDLGAMLNARSTSTGDLDELERAVAALENAVDAFPAGSASQPMHVGNLTHALFNRYDMTKDRGDLDRAVELSRGLVDQFVGSPEHLATAWGNLAVALTMQDAADGRSVVSEEILEAREHAANLTPPGSADYLRHVASWGATLARRLQDRPDESEFERAMAMVEQAVDKARAGSPDLPPVLVVLASLYRVRSSKTHARADVARADDLYRRAIAEGLAVNAKTTLDAAYKWGSFATDGGRWPEAAEAFEAAVDAAHTVTALQRHRRHKEGWLRKVFDLPSQAAYALTRAGAPDRAVMALERARGLIMNEVLGREHVDVADLEALGHAQLAADYSSAVERLRLVDADAPQPGGLTVEGHHIAQSAHDDLVAAIAGIRGVAGYEDFLRPVEFTDVIGHVKRLGSPVVYLVATAVGGVALVVDPTTGTATAVDLPRFTHRDLLPHLQHVINAVPSPPSDPLGLDAATAWLWDAAMSELNGIMRSTERVVLIPTGYLTLFPLHAAWRPDPFTPTGRRYVLDDTLVTYAPTVTTLAHGRRAAEAVPRSILVVEEPSPVSARPLPGARGEAAVAAKAFPTSTVLRAHEATRDAVVGALPNHDVVHFACHGESDLSDPLASGLLLSNDESLTLEHIVAHRLTARLAVLSACETAMIGLELPDEVVSLATGLLITGTTGVIASLWSVPDESTALLMARFYTYWRADEVSPAEALQRAQRWLRDGSNETLASARDLLPDATSLSARRMDPSDTSHPLHWAAFGFLGG